MKTRLVKGMDIPVMPVRRRTILPLPNKMPKTLELMMDCPSHKSIQVPNKLTKTMELMMGCLSHKSNQAPTLILPRVGLRNNWQKTFKKPGQQKW